MATVGWSIGTVQDVTFTDARVVQTSDTTAAVRGELCGTFQLDAYEPTNTIALESPPVYPNGIQLTHVHLNPVSYQFTAADAKDRKAVCSAEARLTDPKKPPTTADEAAILNDLIAKL